MNMKEETAGRSQPPLSELTEAAEKPPMEGYRRELLSGADPQWQELYDAIRQAVQELR